MTWCSDWTARWWRSCSGALPPIVGALADLVAACRGAPAAPARAEQHLTAMASHPAWSDLAQVLERILAGERADQLLGGLTNPVHQAVVTRVKREISD